MSRTLSVAAHYLTPCDEATRLDVELVEDDGDELAAFRRRAGK